MSVLNIFKTKKLLQNSLQYLFPFLSFILPLLLYVSTLAPSYTSEDSAEFALCIKTLGICHPPGFMLYILTSRILTFFLPFGTMQFQVNFLSALYGSLSIYFVYLTLSNLQKNKILSLLLSLLLAISQPFWELSTTADAFSFGALLFSITLFLIIKKRVYLSFFLLGLLTSHFYFPIVLFPILIWYYCGFRLPLKKLLFVCSSFLFGLRPQALIFIRAQENPVINWDHISNLGEYLSYITRLEFGSIFLLSENANQSLLVNFLIYIIYFHWYLILNTLLVLPLIPLYSFLKQKIFKVTVMQFLGISYIIFVGLQSFILIYINPFNPGTIQFAKFFILPFILAFLLLGFTFSRILVNKYSKLILLTFAVLIIISTVLKYPNFNLSKNNFSEDFVNSALSSLPENSIALTLNHQFYFGGIYEKTVNKKYPSVKLVYLPNYKNRDYEKYHPEIFNENPDYNFLKLIRINDSNKDDSDYV